MRVLFAFLALTFVPLTATPRTAQAQDGINLELRFQPSGIAFRQSTAVLPNTCCGPRNDLDLHVPAGVGVRYFPHATHGEGPGDDHHGVLLDARYYYLDVHGISDSDQSRLGFTLVHAGYVYRALVPSRRRPRRFAYGFAAHVSLSVGRTRNIDLVDGVPASSALIGARVGADFDIHMRRFFMGWSLSYEVLRHSLGAMHWSRFTTLNILPLARFGFTLGQRVQGSRRRSR